MEKRPKRNGGKKKERSSGDCFLRRRRRLSPPLASLLIPYLVTEGRKWRKREKGGRGKKEVLVRGRKKENIDRHKQALQGILPSSPPPLVGERPQDERKNGSNPTQPKQTQKLVLVVFLPSSVRPSSPCHFSFFNRSRDHQAFSCA